MDFAKKDENSFDKHVLQDREKKHQMLFKVLNGK